MRVNSEKKIVEIIAQFEASPAERKVELAKKFYFVSFQCHCVLSSLRLADKSIFISEKMQSNPILNDQGWAFLKTFLSIFCLFRTKDTQIRVHLERQCRKSAIKHLRFKD